MKLDCPYCATELTPGFIFSNNQNLRWFPKHQSTLSLLFPLTGRTISKQEYEIGKPKVKTYYCPECNKMVIDLNENWHEGDKNSNDDTTESKVTNKNSTTEETDSTTQLDESNEEELTNEKSKKSPTSLLNTIFDSKSHSKPTE